MGTERIGKLRNVVAPLMEIAGLAWARLGRRSFQAPSRTETRVTPNSSLHPGPATAGVVSPACASGSIITRRAYNTCLRGPGELER